MRAFVESGKRNKEEFTKSRNFMNQKEFAASWNSTSNGYVNSYWNSKRIVTVIAGSSFEPTKKALSSSVTCDCGRLGARIPSRL